MSVPGFLIHQHDGDLVSAHGTLDDGSYAAHAVLAARRVALVFPGAGSVQPQAAGVEGTSDTLDAGEGLRNAAIHQLVHPGDDDHLLGARNHRADPVPRAVDVDQAAVRCDGVAADQVYIAACCAGENLRLGFIVLPVPVGMAAHGLQILVKTHFPKGDAAAEPDGIRLADQLHDNRLGFRHRGGVVNGESLADKGANRVAHQGNHGDASNLRKVFFR